MKVTWYTVVFMIMCMISLTSSYVVTTLSGKVHGKKTLTEGVTLVEFLGIPYAKPPVGNLRFKKPIPIDCWEDVFDASKKPPACIQYVNRSSPWIDHQTEKSEDCLYLNIYAPANSTEQLAGNKKVLFWIHGGAFLHGSSSMDIYDGKTLAVTGDVILVTINYRLGVLGFFSTTLSEAPGNVGLFDSLEALKWVKNNIQYFGGNPDEITISGESAGAMLASYLATSPLSRGLYSRAIIQSGSANNLQLPSVEENVAFCNKVSERVGCSDKLSSLNSDPINVVKCLRGVDAMELSIAGETVLYESGSVALFPQCGDEFLPEKPIETVRKGQFQNSSILIGGMKDEGTFLLPLSFPDKFGDFGEKPFNVTKDFAQSSLSEVLKSIPGYEEIIDHYLNGIEESDYSNIREAMSTLLGDYFFYCPMHNMAERFADNGNEVYFYLFVHRSSNSPYAAWLKTVHFGDVEFVFGMPLQHREKYKKEEIDFSRRIMKLWSNFVKFGNPDAVERRWPKFNRKNSFYMKLDLFTSTVGHGLHKSNYNFWKKYFGFL